MSTPTPNLSFTPKEIRLATATLATLAIIAPTLYYLLPSYSSTESTPHLTTFRKFIAAYSSRRPQALTATASNNFTYRSLPSSRKTSPRNLESFHAHAAQMFDLFESFNMITQDPVHFSKSTNTVTAHCKMGGRVSESSEGGKKLIEQGVEQWWVECVLMVKMDRSGRRVVGVSEFVDSAKAEELRERIEGGFE
ncbi:hypothetical protein B0J11DRAFT_533071 [Dendryphion nanum]|uniref:Uncharacterized protein n=1 Tax=Dendryphion nanum TaxID=256645 RepID=A0A9P9DLY2_9PLEO|nr:hypothetical protein B0J11DRAFT_533071 [Dendryphion nanum]